MMFGKATAKARKRDEEDDIDSNDEDNKEDGRRETGQRRRLHEPTSTTTATDTATTAATCATAASNLAFAAAVKEEAEDEEKEGEVEVDEFLWFVDSDVLLETAAKRWKSDVQANVKNLSNNVDSLCVFIDGGELWEYLSREEMVNDVVLIAAAMERNRTMEEIRLDHLYMDEQAILAIARAIRHQPNLRLVRLANVRILENFLSSSTEDTPVPWKVFSESIASSKSLDELSIYQSETWRYWSMIVSDVLVNSTSIEHLILRCKRKDDDDGNYLMDALLETMPNSASLTHLTLSDFNIDCDDVARLVESLRNVAKLQIVNLIRNKIGPVGLRILMRAMAQHSTWHQLSLCGNKAIGFEGFTIVGEELQQQMTHRQDQNNNASNVTKWIQLNFDACVNFCYCVLRVLFEDDDDETEEQDDETEEHKEHKLQQNMARGRAEQALLNGVKDNVYVTGLELGGSHLGKDALDMIEFYVQLNKMGRYLLGMDHGLAPTIWCYILAKCHAPDPDDHRLLSSVMFFFLREQPDLITPPSQVGATTTAATIQH